MPFATSLYYQSFDGQSSTKIPVVLIHGAGGNHLSWPSEIRRLHGYRIYALDLPGHGKSEGIGLQSIDAYAQAVISWVEAINLNKAFFIGHSMGSAIALTLAHRYSEQVIGLGLIGSSTKFPVNPVFPHFLNMFDNLLRSMSRAPVLRLGIDHPDQVAALAGNRSHQSQPDWWLNSGQG